MQCIQHSELVHKSSYVYQTLLLHLQQMMHYRSRLQWIIISRTLRKSLLFNPFKRISRLCNDIKRSRFDSLLHGFVRSILYSVLMFLNTSSWAYIFAFNGTMRKRASTCTFLVYNSPACIFSWGVLFRFWYKLVWKYRLSSWGLVSSSSSVRWGFIKWCPTSIERQRGAVLGRTEGRGSQAPTLFSADYHLTPYDLLRNASFHFLRYSNAGNIWHGIV